MQAQPAEPAPPDTLEGIVSEALSRFLGDLTAALPKLLAGLVFLAIGAIVVKVVMFFVGQALDQVLSGESPVYRQFLRTIVAAFLWFGIVLTFLSIVGLSGIAVAMGTASGFLALGVSYALSGMLADAVAGIYLLRDPDFNPGDRVTAGDTTGTVRAIELRKTRIESDGDTVVRANAEIEKKWTKLGGEEESVPTE